MVKFARVGHRPAPTWSVVARASAFATSSTAEMDFLSESDFDTMREAMALYDEQAKNGRHFLHEHPAGATSWG